MRKLMSILFVMLALNLSGCYQYVNPGHVGVVVNLSGGNKGVDPTPVNAGRVFYNPFTQEIHEFPIFEQNCNWVGPDAIQFSSAQSIQITSDVSVYYSIAPESTPPLFSKLRRDVDYIGNQWLKNHVKDAMNRAAEDMETMSILGKGKSEITNIAKEDLNNFLKPYGISINTLSFAGPLRPAPQIQQNIDDTTRAEQQAKQAREKVAQNKAEADGKIEDARGRAESVVLEAKAKLEASKLEAEANLELSKSLTPQIIQYEIAKNWNGVLPKVTGNATPIINLNDLDKENVVVPEATK